MGKTAESPLRTNEKKKYRTPDGYTADIAIFTLIANEAYQANETTVSKFTLALMLIKRAKFNAEGEPNTEGEKWALPGGFIQPEETAFEAAKRELQEETGVDGIHVHHYGVYDKLGRDNRGWIITNAHYALVPEQYISNRAAADDAAVVQLFSIQQIEQLELAFDHKRIIADAIESIKKDMLQTTVSKNFLPDEFKLEDLRNVLLAVIQDPIIKTKSSFFRKAPSLPFIEEARDEDNNPKTTIPSGVTKRPTRLYQFSVEGEIVPSIWSLK